jgi:hypothetical protein
VRVQRLHLAPVEVGQHGLAAGGAVGGHPGAGAQPDPQRLVALHAVDEAHVGACRHDQVDGLADPLEQVLEEGPHHPEQLRHRRRHGLCGGQLGSWVVPAVLVLQLAPNATRLLRRHGLLDDLLETAVLPRRLVAMNALTGQQLTALDLEQVRRRYGAPTWSCTATTCSR